MKRDRDTGRQLVGVGNVRPLVRILRPGPEQRLPKQHEEMEPPSEVKPLNHLANDTPEKPGQRPADTRAAPPLGRVGAVNVLCRLWRFTMRWGCGRSLCGWRAEVFPVRTWASSRPAASSTPSLPGGAMPGRGGARRGALRAPPVSRLGRRGLWCARDGEGEHFGAAAVVLLELLGDVWVVCRPRCVTGCPAGPTRPSEPLAQVPLGGHSRPLAQPSVGIDFGLATCLEAGCRGEGFGVGGEDRPGQQGILG